MSEEIICFDPRDVDQHEDDMATWKPTRNPALIAAHLVAPDVHLIPGFWQGVAERANFCDEFVHVDRVYVRKTLGGIVPDDEIAKATVEEIQRAIDADITWGAKK